MGQESRSGLLDWFWLRVSHEIVVKISAWAPVIWRLDWCLEGHFQRARSHGCRVSAGCWQEASVSHHMDLSRGLLESSDDVQLNSSRRVIQKRGKWKPHVFYDLASEVTLCHVYDISNGYTGEPFYMWKGTDHTRMWTPEGENHLGGWLPHTRKVTKHSCPCVTKC